MTAEIFAEKFDAHVDAVDAAFVRAIESARSAPREERMQYMHVLMMRQLDSVNAEAVQRAGLTEEEFQVRHLASLDNVNGNARHPDEVSCVYDCSSTT